MSASVLQPKSAEGTYTFASQPRAVPQRPKYKSATSSALITQENETTPLYGNIMYDRRVVRGSTYAQHTLPASAQPDPIEVQRQQEARRREISRKRAKQQLRTKSPEPVEGRKHIDVQTELYLEELSDRVEEADVDCQTDAFLDRAPSPLFIPAKSGIDVETQIMEGELFDFNIEVQPVLEVLVGKTMEQALVEVMEEEELANLREQQRMFEELRNTEVVEQQRLEEQERRRREEKERRIKQQEEVLKKEKETADKIAAKAFAQSYLADMVPNVFGTLAENGYFYDPVERSVEREFMPWLMDQVDARLQKSTLSRKILDGIIREVVQQRLEQFAKLIPEVPEVIEQPAEGTQPVPTPAHDTADKTDEPQGPEDFSDLAGQPPTAADAGDDVGATELGDPVEYEEGDDD